jgi:hypothetical protein
LLDFLTLLLVFINIRGLFLEFWSSEVQDPTGRHRSAHLPICLPALAFPLLDFSTALGGRNHRQERENKKGLSGITDPAGINRLPNPTK